MLEGLLVSIYFLFFLSFFFQNSLSVSFLMYPIILNDNAMVLTIIVRVLI